MFRMAQSPSVQLGGPWLAAAGSRLRGGTLRPDEPQIADCRPFDGSLLDMAYP